MSLNLIKKKLFRFFSPFAVCKTLFVIHHNKCSPMTESNNKITIPFYATKLLFIDGFCLHLRHVLMKPKGLDGIPKKTSNELSVNNFQILGRLSFIQFPIYCHWLICLIYFSFCSSNKNVNHNFQNNFRNRWVSSSKCLHQHASLRTSQFVVQSEACDLNMKYLSP